MSENFNEVFLGYCMNNKEKYDAPIKIDSPDKFGEFLKENITKFYEIRITDSGDNLVFHVVDQVLLFPIPARGKRNNKWDNIKKQFVNL